MTWRYCITRERIKDVDVFAVREVYTDDAGKLSWTKDAMEPYGETWAEIADDLSKMTSAINGRVLDLTLDPPQLVKKGDLR